MTRYLFFQFAMVLPFLLASKPVAKGDVLVTGQPSAAKYFASEIVEPAGLPCKLLPHMPPPSGFKGFSVVVFVEPDLKSNEAQWQWNLGENGKAVASYVEAGGKIFLVGGRLPFLRDNSEDDLPEKQPLITELLGIAKIGKTSPDSEVRARAADEGIGIFDGPEWKEGVVLAPAGSILTAITAVDSAEPLLEAVSGDGQPLILAARHRLGKGAIYWLSLSPFRVARSSNEEIQKSSMLYSAAITRLIQEELQKGAKR